MMSLRATCVVCALSVFGLGTVAAQQQAPPSDASSPPHVVPKPESEFIFGLQVEPEFVRLPSNIRAESAGKSGLRVVHVEPGSMAELAGLQPGDILYKINGKRLRSFDDVLDVLSELRPNVQGQVDFVRGNATFIKTFTLSETFTKDFNLLYLILCRESRFAKRFDVLGIVCNVKENSLRSLGTFKLLVPLLLSYHRIGDTEKTTTLVFLTFRKGTPKPVSF